jgi:hypothetical protein
MDMRLRSKTNLVESDMEVSVIVLCELISKVSICLEDCNLP